MASGWGVPPKQSILAEVRSTGVREVAGACVAILEGRTPDGRFLYVLAGPASRPVLRGAAGGIHGYWPKVWALRGLRYAWDASAEGLVVEATADEAWRVREMAAKVIRVHLIDDGFDALGRLIEDPVPRVRVAATSARAALVRAGARRESSRRPGGHGGLRSASKELSSQRRRTGRTLVEDPPSRADSREVPWRTSRW